MEAIAFTSHGPLKNLKKTRVPYPHGFNAAANVLIKVSAASINPVDQLLLKGELKLVFPVAASPHVISYDVAGVVEEADTGGKFKVGDPVIVRLGSMDNKEEDGPKTPWYRGAMAEFCVARVQDVVMKPANISFEEAASLPLAGMTAYQALKLAGLKEGGSVLITGGAGGVGTYLERLEIIDRELICLVGALSPLAGTLAIQLAKHVFKAGMVATTASAGTKTNLVKDLGADVVVDYKTEKFEKTLDAASFDAVLDCTDESGKAVQLVKNGGKIVTIAGIPSLESIQSVGGTGCLLAVVLAKTAARAEFKQATAAGVGWEHHFCKPSAADLQAVADAVAAGTVKPVLEAKVWNAWDEDTEAGWRGAFAKQFSGRAAGKCVVAFTRA